MAASRPKLVITHGEEKARTALAAKAKERFGLESIIPEAGQVLEL